MNFDKIIQLIGMVEEPKETYTYGCLMLYLPDTIQSYWQVWKDLIDSEDYDADGFEDEPHVTVQYGFADHVTAGEVIAQIEPFPCEIKFGAFSLFENDNDVLKIDIISSDLRKLNKKINDKFDITSSYPDYKPHATVAYLKKGMGKKYIEKLKNPLQGKTCISNRFCYSSPKYEKEYFNAFKTKDFFN